MYGSFNSYGSKSRSIGPTHKPVWLGTLRPVPVGGVLAEAFRKDGILIPAGTPIKYANKTITPLVAWEVVSLTAGETNDTLVIKPCVYGNCNFLPAASDKIMKLGASFAATGKAAAVIAVNALTGDDAGKYSVTFLHSATIDNESAGDYIVLSSAESAGNSKSVANQPNAYLGRDIFIEADENPNATGDVIVSHPEGVLIDFTPAAPFASQMAVAVPQVYQHKL